MNVATRFGENLLRARELADLTQEELGSRVALHRSEIGLIENGARLPRIDTLIKLGGGLGVDPGDLLTTIVWQPRAFASGSFKPSALPRPKVMTVAARFGENLARHRRRAALPQTVLARRAEVHRTHISLLERGQRKLRIDTLIKLAGSLAIDPGDLLEGIAWVPGDGDRSGHFEIWMPNG